MIDDTISRQTAIKAIEDLPDCYNGFSDTYDKACIIGVLEEIPAADAVEVVRCKDCDFCISSEKSISRRKCDLRGDFVFSNDYCSYAVRRKQ